MEQSERSEAKWRRPSLEMSWWHWEASEGALLSRCSSLDLCSACSLIFSSPPLAYTLEFDGNRIKSPVTDEQTHLQLNSGDDWSTYNRSEGNINKALQHPDREHERRQQPELGHHPPSSTRCTLSTPEVQPSWPVRCRSRITLRRLSGVRIGDTGGRLRGGNPSKDRRA